MSTSELSPISQNEEWVIQRCTQRWVGFELQYEDFPTSEGRMTRDRMLSVLERVSREHPNDEFRGHRVLPDDKRM
jgi:hypothetical protein